MESEEEYFRRIYVNFSGWNPVVFEYKYKINLGEPKIISIEKAIENLKKLKENG